MKGLLSIGIMFLFIFLVGCNNEISNDFLGKIEKKSILGEVVNEDVVDELDNILDDASETTNILSVSISVDGEVVKERYYNSANENYKNHVFFVTKSITYLMVGIAIEQGYIESVDQSIGDFVDLESYSVDYYNKTFAYHEFGIDLEQ